jgi:hypothetical protein
MPYSRPLLIALSLALGLGVWAGYLWRGSGIIHATEPFTIANGPIIFVARLDTGAAISSINARDVVVTGADESHPRRDIGKPIHFTLVNEKDESVTLDSTVSDVKSVRTGDCREWRYHVYLTLIFHGRKERLLVNLNDRSASSEKMLVGRDFLEHGYAVQVGDP